MTRISYINGEFTNHSSASIHIDDRGFIFSDGVYEVVLIRNNTLIDWQAHCARLQNSLNGLKIKYDVSENELSDIIQHLLSKNSLTNAMLYLQITRGTAPRDHQFPVPPPRPNIIITVSPFSSMPQEVYDKGVSVITRPDLRWKRRDYKTISLLPNILAKQEAVAANAMETILIEDDGYITEGSATNFYIIGNDNIIRTHPANERILAGITRMGVLEVAKRNNILFQEEMFTLSDAMNASAAFITSTTKHVLPVTNIDGKKIGDGQVHSITKHLINLYSEFIEEQIQ